jgi:hypothetical protein
MEGTSALAYVALIGFPLVVYLAFHFLGPQRGTIASLIGGWMFLPSYSKGLGLPLLHSKGMFVPAVVLAASLILDTRAWQRLRLRLLDLPMMVFVAVPLFTSLSNNLGAYDGFSACLEIGSVWGAPYLLGRLYLGEPRALRNLAKGLIVGAVVYVPLCLWEIRMSPQLHGSLYGFVSSGAFVHNVRFGGYRPTVFMLTGLMVGTFMATGTLVTLWMWRTRALRSLMGVPLGSVAALLVVTTVLVKSVAAVLLMIVGFITLEVARRFRTPLLVLALMALPPAFTAARLSGWDADAVVRLSRESVGGDRAQSVDFRLRNEQLLVEKAKQRPWLGWGRWGRARITDDFGRDVTITDSLWVITLGTFGFLGLVAQWLALALPGWALLRLYPARFWGDPRLAAAVVLSVALQLWVIDDLLNAMVTPIFPVIAGALVSFVAVGRRARFRRPRQTSAPADRPTTPAPLADGHGA